jgi:hypothetical protein
MRQLKSTGTALLIALALGMVATAAAQAEEAPYWSIEGTRLAANKTFEIRAKALGSQGDVKTNGGIPVPGDGAIVCTAVKFAKGAVILGSNAGEPGKGSETIEYSGCTVTEDGTECNVENGEIKTEPLKNELAYAANKKSLVVTYTPVKGTVYATIKFTGSGCIVTSTKVTGVVVAGVFTDAAEPVLLELPKPVTPAESFLFSSAVTARSKIWLIKGGVGSEVETEEITVFGVEGYVSGTLLISLGEKGEATKKKWSPLL